MRNSPVQGVNWTNCFQFSPIPQTVRESVSTHTTGTGGSSMASKIAHRLTRCCWTGRITRSEPVVVIVVSDPYSSRGTSLVNLFVIAKQFPHPHCWGLYRPAGGSQVEGTTGAQRWLMMTTVLRWHLCRMYVLPPRTVQERAGFERETRRYKLHFFPLNYKIARPIQSAPTISHSHRGLQSGLVSRAGMPMCEEMFLFWWMFNKHLKLREGCWMNSLLSVIEEIVCWTFTTQKQRHRMECLHKP